MVCTLFAIKMEEFEASEIVARVGEGEVPNLQHSCSPSTYKGVGQQVNILEIIVGTVVFFAFNMITKYTPPTRGLASR